MAPEGAAHDLRTREAATARNALDRVAVGLEQRPGAFDPDQLDVVGGSRPELTPEDAAELPLGEVEATGERPHREVLAGMLRDPGLEVVQG